MMDQLRITNDELRIADEELNELADWFLKSRCGTVLDITFLQYLENTDYYDDLFDAVQMGAALTRRPDGIQEIIGNHGIMQHVGANSIRPFGAYCHTPVQAGHAGERMKQ